MENCIHLLRNTKKNVYYCLMNHRYDSSFQQCKECVKKKETFWQPFLKVGLFEDIRDNGYNYECHYFARSCIDNKEVLFCTYLVQANPMCSKCSLAIYREEDKKNTCDLSWWNRVKEVEILRYPFKGHKAEVIEYETMKYSVKLRVLPSEDNAVPFGYPVSWIRPIPPEL